jgi:hypothetical protein
VSITVLQFDQFYGYARVLGFGMNLECVLG